MSAVERSLVFVGDVHLGPDDPWLPRFLAFLDRLADSASRVVLMGDLFELWIGRPELEQPHQAAVAGHLRALRERGLVVRYLEGNRDYHIGPGYAGRALDEATDRPIVEEFGGRRLVAVHGDLANAKDRQYRAWRRLSRSRGLWLLFNALPRGPRLRLAHALERRMRGTNPAFRRAFPEQAVRDYAARLLTPQDDALVLGHFHVELDLAPQNGGARGRVLVLPDWKSSRRHLRVDAAGEIAFVDSVS